MPRPPRDQGNPQQQPRHWLDHWLVYGTIAAALAAALAAVMSGWQAYLTRQNNIVSQRAFISIENPNVITALDSRDKTTKILSLWIPFVNSGNTATKELNLFARCAPSTDAMPEPWVLLYREKVERKPQIIGPHQTGKAYCTFPMDQIIQARAGSLHLYLMGEVIYRNRLDASAIHRTQFSWELIDINIIEPPKGPGIPEALPTVAVNFKPIGIHNCADEDCPNN